MKNTVRLTDKFLRSSFWLDKESRDMWIMWLAAALAAKPYEVVGDGMEQLEVSSMKFTGWVVPAGRYGFASVAGPWLVCYGLGVRREDTAGMEAGYKLLERLCSPNPGYGGEFVKYDGRRLARVDGGYLVLDYTDYVSSAMTNAERVKRCREKKKREFGNVDITGVVNQ